jgi:ferredoxin
MMIKINISSNVIGEPILAESMIETRTALNISQAHFDSTYGEIIAEVETGDFKAIREALESKGAKVTVLDHPIVRDEEECVECGACISVCPSHVFSFGEDWGIAQEIEKCIQCGTCIKMCPHRALNLEK